MDDDAGFLIFKLRQLEFEAFLYKTFVLPFTSGSIGALIFSVLLVALFVGIVIKIEFSKQKKKRQQAWIKQSKRAYEDALQDTDKEEAMSAGKAYYKALHPEQEITSEELRSINIEIQKMKKPIKKTLMQASKVIPQNNILNEIERLAELQKQGVLSTEEFVKAKEIILANGINMPNVVEEENEEEIVLNDSEEKNEEEMVNNGADITNTFTALPKVDIKVSQGYRADAVIDPENSYAALSKIDIRVSPDDTADVFTKIDEGSIVIFLKEGYEDKKTKTIWYKIGLPDGKEGWCPSKKLKKK